jgi:hypothetical protein
MRALALCCSWLLVPACTKPLMQDEGGRLRVVAECARAELADALRQHRDVSVVVTLAGSFAESGAANGAVTGVPVVGIGAAPAAEDDWPAALVLEPTGADIAIELALLACNGVAITPKPVAIGTRTVTAANRAAGGAVQRAPGDIYVELLRQQHRAELTTTPATDEVHFVGLLCVGDGPRPTRIAGEAAAAAARFPQLELRTAGCEPTADAAATAAAEMVRSGCRVVLIAADTATTIAAAAQAVHEANPAEAVAIALDPMVADHGVCSVGCAPATLGRAAAAAVTALLPDGGAIVLVHEQPIAAATAGRRAGFADALRLKRP